MKILNTGGTYNKRYNPLTGMMEVPYDNYALEAILKDFNNPIEMAGVIYKDSLEFTMEDRKMLASIIHADDEKYFVIIHGTDTIDQTAEFLDTIFDDRVILLTGAMVPFEIDPIEASVNLGLCIGFTKANPANGVYICMNGEIAPYKQLVKNRSIGRFELV